MGQEIKQADFVQIQRSILYAGRYLKKGDPLINPRYRMLLLILYARQMKGRPLRAYWASLARDLGVGTSTVRKWAYELRDAGYLGIRVHQGRVKDPEGNPHYRDERNYFDLKPLSIAIQSKLEPLRQKERENYAKRRAQVGEEE